MKFTFLLTLVLFGIIQSSENCAKKTMKNSNNTNSQTPRNQSKFDNLPENIKPETEVVKEVENDKGQIISREITTVGKRLIEMKARYENNKLVDGAGREIRFFEPLCRGASQGFEEDEKARLEKEKELSDLKKNYTVIVLFCDARKAV